MSAKRCPRSFRRLPKRLLGSKKSCKNKLALDHLVEKNNLDTKIKELELLLSNIKQDTVAIREEREDYAQQLDRSQRLKKEAETNVAELERQLENEIQKANSVSSEKTKRIES